MKNLDDKTITKGAIRYLIRAMIAPVFMGLLYFLAAGNMANTRAWIYYILFFLLSFCVNIILYIKNKTLLYHRSSTKKDAVGWDKWLMPVALLIGFHLQSIIMGLEDRILDTYNSNYTLAIGLILLLISYIITTWAMLVNQHFEANVRIQKDRDHQVISTGPYSVVRHPGYLAFILATFAIPFIIGSNLGFINAIIGSLLLLIRTHKEDQTLNQELKGYPEYSQKVLWKILPVIW